MARVVTIFLTFWFGFLAFFSLGTVFSGNLAAIGVGLLMAFFGAGLVAVGRFIARGDPDKIRAMLEREIEAHEETSGR